MWIIARDGFVSLVQHEQDPRMLRARARRKEHLVETFDLDDAAIIDLGVNAPDYRWHADVNRVDAARIMADAVMNVDYTSHVKESVTGDDRLFYVAMLDCWRALLRLQRPDPRPHDWFAGRSSQGSLFDNAPPFDLDDYDEWASRNQEELDRRRALRDGWPDDDDEDDDEKDLGTLLQGTASRMLASLDSEGGEYGTAGLVPPGPLTVQRWYGDGTNGTSAALFRTSECIICAGDGGEQDKPFVDGDEYVILPEDATYGDPAGPAHIQCAEDEGWEASF